ncbi:MAG: hypothetical protein FJ278_16570 [Planctomycetes bacterium]|nr:hypothetical protein [Planctomycetota bacterium]
MSVKANISVPNPVHKAAERLARKLGVSLSELYTTALAAYVSSHQETDVTEALNRVYRAEPSAIEPGLVKIQVACIGGETW